MYHDSPSTLRSYLSTLERNNELRREKKEVNPKFEIAALHMKAQAEKGPALLFENVKGSGMPVLVNLLSSRRRLALAMNLPVDIGFEPLNAEMEKRVSRSIAPEMVDTGPCKEVILEGNKVDLSKYPILTMHEKDAGPYITGGFVVARDPDTGEQNLSFHRLLLSGKNRLGIFMEPRHLRHMWRKADERNEPLKIAIVIGYHPAVGMAAVAGLPYGQSEYGLAGSLAGSPIQLTKAEDSGVLVPADAEIIMEGEILPKVRMKEGPYGEYTGYYGIVGDRPVVEVRKITQRRDALYYSITARSSEVGYYFIAKTARTAVTLKEALPGIKSANFLGTFFFVISLKKEREGDGRKAMLTAIAANDSVKYCVAVDDDVNSRNPEEVLCAIATRCDPSKGIFVIPHTFGQVLDPSAEGEDEGRVWSLMCIDATTPIDKSFQERARIPTLEEVERMRQQGLL